ncbi:MAG: GGDEF domain-containing protein [Bacilli bacterium]|jgi:diguanylate cyclase (GGDEF)-like protein|nr:GGDEF domain-containing protein [Bacilli bacterium]
MNSLYVFPFANEAFSVFALILLVVLANRNLLINKEKTKYYTWLAGLISMELILEMVFMAIDTPSTSQVYIVINRIDNFLGFSLLPFVPAVFISVRRNYNKKLNLWTFIPACCNIIFLIFNLFFGFIYKVDNNNNYVRGSWYYLESGILGLYIAWLAIGEIRYLLKQNIDRSDVLLMSTIYLFPIGGGVIQAVFERCYVMWPSIALAAILYYLFMREKENKVDRLTGTFNRACFIKKMDYLNKRMERTYSSLLVAVFDINHFKQINDECGHLNGDETLRKVGETLSSSFKNDATIYRTGGDEFCLISTDMEQEEFKAILMDVNKKISLLSPSSLLPLHLAVGYAIMNDDDRLDVYRTYKRADEAMYIDKSSAHLQEQK